MIHKATIWFVFYYIVLEQIVQENVRKLAKRIFVGNLPFSTEEAQVQDLFTPFGDVESVVMINDRDTGRFRGFCFVEMDNSAADEAIRALDGQDFDGRALRVNEARPREERRGGGGGNNIRRGGNNNNYGNRNRGYPDSGGGRRW